MGMDVHINIEDYLSDSDKQEIAKEVFKEQLETKFKEDGERIISNASYEIVSRRGIILVHRLPT